MNNKILLDKIKADKEILETMPVNNEKNIEKYNETLKEIEKEYLEEKNKIIKEIKNRYNSYIANNNEDNIQKVKKELNDYENIIDILNNIKSPYEKSKLNKELYRLGKYYKDNLENVNNQILMCINIFKKLGVNVSDTDFNISNFVKEYMQVFFEEINNGNINSENIKNKFEEIYWKCPDIIIHIEICLKNIYIKNIKNLNKYYLHKQQDILSKYKTEYITEQCFLKRKEIEKLELVNKQKIINKFINKELNIKDYEKSKIKAYYEKILSNDILNSLEEDEKNLEQINLAILKLENNLYEYKKFLEYKFIVNEVINIYKQKEKYKTLYKTNLKKIKTKEAKLRKLNIRAQYKKNKNNNEISILIHEIKNEYKELTRSRFYSKISTEITGATSIYSALSIASCFYEFLVDCFVKNDEKIQQAEIDKKINELEEFVKFPHFTILNNVYIDENKDIALIIKDRYKLLNFNIEKEDLEENKLDELLEILEKLKINYAMEKCGLDIDEISNLCKFKEIINENN